MIWRRRVFKQAVSELISTILLTSIAIAVGLVAFYMINNWAYDVYQRSRIFNLADNAIYDFNANIEAYSKSENGYNIYIRIIRIGGLQISGMSIFISVEATNIMLKSGSEIWSVSTSDLYILDAERYISFSDPIDPINMPSSPKLISFTSCGSTAQNIIRFNRQNNRDLYIRSLDQWVSLGDFKKDLTMTLCKTPLPPAPLGHIIVNISLPAPVANYQNIVISGWIMIGGKMFNIFNILYRNM